MNIKVGDVWLVGSSGYPWGRCLVHVTEINGVGVYGHIVDHELEDEEGIHTLMGARRKSAWCFLTRDFVKRVRKGDGVVYVVDNLNSIKRIGE